MKSRQIKLSSYETKRVNNVIVKKINRTRNSYSCDKTRFINFKGSICSNSEGEGAVFINCVLKGNCTVFGGTYINCIIEDNVIIDNKHSGSEYLDGNFSDNLVFIERGV